MTVIKFLILFIISLPVCIYAKAVKVDEILTEENKLKLDLSLSYANINKKSDSFSSITYQTTYGDFVTIPTYTGTYDTNQDYINYGFNLKYGINKSLELFSNLNLFTSETHVNDSAFTDVSTKGFSNLNFGFTYQVKKEDNSPSFLLGGSTYITERTTFSDNSKKNIDFKSYSIYMTSYYTVDPIVFLIRVNYKLNLEKEYEDKTIKDGNVIIISPSIYFAVNPYTSINWGVKYQFQGKSRTDGEVISNQSSSIGYTFGVSYEISSKIMFNFDTEKLDTNDYSSNSINLALSYKF